MKKKIVLGILFTFLLSACSLDNMEENLADYENGVKISQNYAKESSDDLLGKDDFTEDAKWKLDYLIRGSNIFKQKPEAYLVYFYDEGVNNALLEMELKLYETQKDRYPLYKVNISLEEELDTKLMLGITETPTLILVKREGRDKVEVWRNSKNINLKDIPVLRN